MSDPGPLSRSPEGTPGGEARIHVFHSRYDAFGNLTAKAENSAAQTTMAYADGQHLTSLTIGSGPATTLAYDALGRTATRTASVTETYRYVGTSDVIDAVSDGVTTRTSLVDATGSRLAWTSGGTTTWTLFDALGSLVALIGPGSGNPLAEVYRYDGYGQELRGTADQTDITAGTHNPFRFRGALNLGTDGEPLYAMGARLYAPSAGAWTTLDTYAGTAQDPASMNRFTYVTGNPTSLVDPTGHMVADCGGENCSAIIVENRKQAEKKKQSSPTSSPRSDTGGSSENSPYPRITAAAQVPAAPVVAPMSDAVSANQDALCSMSSTALWCQMDQQKAGQMVVAETVAAGTIVCAFTPGCLVAAGDALSDASLLLPAGSTATAGGTFTAAVGGSAFIAKASGALDKAAGWFRGALRLGDEAAQVSGGMRAAVSDCAHSFAADTPVATAAGLVAIATIEPGDTVLAADPDTGDTGDYEVTATFAHTDPVSLTLVLDGERVVTTPGHLFMTADGWTEAQDLVPGETVLRADGATGSVVAMSWEYAPAVRYDLTVATVHTFFVGEGRFWVHNAGPCDDLVDLVSADRRTHILDGEVRADGSYGGGHRAGTGYPDKTEFPAAWSDDQVMHHVSDVATDPAATEVSVPNQRPGDKWYTGTRDGYEIQVLIRNKQIWTAYPINVPRNPWP